MNEVSFLFLRNPGYDAEINFLQFPLFDHTVKDPFAFFIRAPGAFLVLAILVAIMNASGIKNRANKMTEGCDGCCASCSSSCDKKEG